VAINLWEELAKLIVYIIPAMVANGSPVVIGRMLDNKHPIDFGKNFLDGYRILGDGKTWEGFVGGIAAGTLSGLILGLLFSKPLELFTVGLLSSLGALIGDIIGSFIKRRLKLERGHPAPILDQLDFYFGAILFLYVAGYKLSIIAVLIFAPVIWILHRTTNYLAYKLRMKSEPY
jgi:CDP-2,3-bis-(O-geranylgeranyl)-sn-glycerol synthase